VGFDQISEKPKKTKKKKPFHNTTLFFLSQKLYHPKQGKKITPPNKNSGLQKK
jgi:hypothetical protein